MKHILVLHGPNLNLLGKRETSLYGSTTLKAINQSLIDEARKYTVSLEACQTNSESILIDKIHAAMGSVDFILFNPAAFTHTSIALRDALLAVNIPFIEVHITNLQAREPFRHTSYFSDIAQGVISGLGVLGYKLALQSAIVYCNNKDNALIDKTLRKNDPITS